MPRPYRSEEGRRDIDEVASYDEPRPYGNRPRLVDKRPVSLADPRSSRFADPWLEEQRPSRLPEARKPIEPTVDDIGAEPDYRALLTKLAPAHTFSVEMPYAGNGNLFQVRTSILGEVFFGRADTEDEAIVKCCKKATKFVLQQREGVGANVWVSLGHRDRRNHIESACIPSQQDACTRN